MRKDEEHKEMLNTVKKLREDGYQYSEIADYLNCSVEQVLYLLGEVDVE